MSTECHRCGAALAIGDDRVIGRVSHGFGMANKEEFTFCGVECRARWSGDDVTIATSRQLNLDEYGADVDDDLPAPPEGWELAHRAPGASIVWERVDGHTVEVRRVTRGPSAAFGNYYLRTDGTRLSYGDAKLDDMIGRAVDYMAENVPVEAPEPITVEADAPSPALVADGGEELEGLAAFGVDVGEEPEGGPVYEGDVEVEEDDDELDGEDRGRIKHHAERGDLSTLLFTLDVSGPQIVRKFTEVCPTIEAIVEHYDEHGDFQAVEGIGPTKSERIEAAIPMIREAIGLDDEDDVEAGGTGEPVEVVDEFRGEVRRRVEVPAGKVELYELLVAIVEADDDARVRELMPADLAVECDDLVDVLELLDTLYKGRVDVNGIGYGMGYVLDMKRAIENYRDREPDRIVAVGCSASKNEADEPLPAADRYRGGYWTNKREYAEAAADGGEWRIISAEHDLLDPSTPIDYYETTVDDLEGVEVDVARELPNGDRVETALDLWALRVYEGLAEWLQDFDGDGVDPRDVELQVLLGRSYEDPLRERGVFDALDVRGELLVSFPFREVEGLTGIGKQRQWLGEQAEELCESELATDGGEIKVEAAAAPSMDVEQRAEDLQERTALKRREAEVQARKEAGLSHSQIADELGLAKATVDEYSRRINDRRERARATVEQIGGQAVVDVGDLIEAAEIVESFHTDADIRGDERAATDALGLYKRLDEAVERVDANQRS